MPGGTKGSKGNSGVRARGSGDSDGSAERDRKQAKPSGTPMEEGEPPNSEPIPAYFAAFMAHQNSVQEAAAARDLAFQQAAVAREDASTARLDSLIKIFNDKFAVADDKNAQIDATLIRMQEQLDAQAAATERSFAALQRVPPAPSGWPAPGASGASGSAQPPPFTRVGGDARPLRGSAGNRNPPDGSRSKVFFKGFPAEIPRRLLTSWFDTLYNLTDKEAGLERHIGSNKAFAVSFPSAAGAKRFMDQVRTDALSLDYLHRGVTTTIKMEPQYRSSEFGKALASVWPLFDTAVSDFSTAAKPVKLLVDTDRGRFRAEVEDEILLLAHIDGDSLILNEGGISAIGFSAAARAGVVRDFVA